MGYQTKSRAVLQLKGRCSKSLTQSSVKPIVTIIIEESCSQ